MMILLYALEAIGILLFVCAVVYVFDVLWYS